MSYNIKTKKLPKSEVEIEVSLPTDLLSEAKKKAVNAFGVSLEIPGFRKGHIPENIVIEKVGDGKILEEAADILLREHFPKIIDEAKLDVIGQPKISITKLGLGSPMEFKAIITILPEFDLPDYKKIASNINAEPASDKDTADEKEIADVLLQIRKNKAHFDYHKDNPDEKGHDHQKLDLEKEENLPKLDDELARAAGNFKDLNELKEKVKENIIEEKKIRNAEKKRAAIMEELIKKTKIELPNILIESETEKSLAQMKDDIERMGGKFEDYLVQTNKTVDDLKKDLKENSENRAKVQLIFNKIAETEKIEPDKEILGNETKEIVKHYPNTSETSARIYVSTILLNQAVLKLLERQ